MYSHIIQKYFTPLPNQAFNICIPDAAATEWIPDSTDWSFKYESYTAIVLCSLSCNHALQGSLIYNIALLYSYSQSIFSIFVLTRSILVTLPIVHRYYVSIKLKMLSFCDFKLQNYTQYKTSLKTMWQTLNIVHFLQRKPQKYEKKINT